MRDLLISNAISSGGSRDIGLLSGVPPETLIELRRAGAMTELRSLIGKGVQEIDTATQSAFGAVGETVTKNLSEAFSKHQKELRALSTEHKKFFGFHVGRWITFGGVSIGAACTGSTALGVLAACLGMIGTPSPEELRKRWADMKSQKEQLSRSPAGILFRHAKKRQKRTG